MADHARFSMSSLGAYIKCPGRRHAEDQVNTLVKKLGIKGWGQSDYATEGTEAHGWLEEVMVFGTRTEDVPDKAMASAIRDFLQVFSDYSQPGDQVFVEYRVKYTADVWGTADLILWNPNTRWLRVIDFKYGLGDEVQAEGNHQLGGYAAAFKRQHKVNPKKVTAVIVQPRKHHVDDWDIPDMWFEALAIQVRYVELSDNPNSVQVAGAEQCQYCSASGQCATELQQVLAALKNPEADMKQEDLAKALDSRKLVKNWLEAVDTAATLMWESGADIPGWKKVKGSGRRHWIDEEKVAEILRSDPAIKEDLITCTKTRSPAQIEAWAGKDHLILKKYVAKTEGKPKWVPEHFKGQPIQRINDDIESFDEI